MHALGVVGHSARLDMVDHMLEMVRADVVSVDDGTFGCEGNHRRVWGRLAAEHPRSSWSVVLEDDAQPVDNFDAQIEAALRTAPTPIVSLYLGRVRPVKCQTDIAAAVARDYDAHWFVSNRLMHAVGVAIRTPLVDDMLSWTSRPPVIGRPIDEAVSRWATARRLQIAYTWPSLVEHADTPTVIARHQDGAPRPPGRRAWRAGGRSKWRSRVAGLHLPALPHI